MKALRSLSRGAALAVFLGVTLAASLASGAESVWKPLAPAPEPRQEVAYTALDGRIYLAAGNALDQDRYDPLANAWTEVAHLPAGFEGLDHVDAAAVDGKLVYAGGLSKWEYPFPVSDEVAIYDPVADDFASGTDMPRPRAAGGTVAWHGKLIYAGGLGPEGSVARVDAYDPQTGEWTRLRDMPRPRDHFQLAVVGDEFYAVGGRRTVGNEGRIEVEDLAEVDELELPADDGELASAEWNPAVTSIPTDRGGLGVAAVGDCIYAIGGERAIGGDEVTGAVESYDTANGEWRELPPLPTPRHGIQAATIGGAIYVAGGGTVPFDYAPTDAHESLEVSETWPCTAVEREPESEPGPEPESTPKGPTEPMSRTAGQSETRITHLAVRPRELLLHGAGRRQRARIVLFLSKAGRVWLRVPGEFRFSRRLHTGRNVLPMPIGPHGRPLPPGRYLLTATAHLPGGRDAPARAWFRVVP